MITRCANSLLTYSCQYTGDIFLYTVATESYAGHEASEPGTILIADVATARCHRPAPSKMLTEFEFWGFFIVSAHTVSYPEPHPREEIIGILLPMVANFQKHE